MFPKTDRIKSLYPILGVLLLLLTFALYWQTRSFDFITYDDPMYVYEQPGVTNGLTAASMKWAFTNIESGSWQPLTFLSYQAEVALFGVNPRLMHLNNALLHSINAALLFMFLTGLFGVIHLNRDVRSVDNHVSCGLESNNDSCPCRVQMHDGKTTMLCLAAFLAAAFWAWHPLRVESVAWISSRKDVLCILFYLIGHIAYLQTLLLKNRGRWNRSITDVCFVAAFLSKPSAIVYPLTLALLEFFVCRDWRISRSWRYIFILPLCFIVTYYTQAQTDSITHVSLWQRILNSLVNLWQYVAMTLAPQNVCVFYKSEYPTPIVKIFPALGFLAICCVVLFYPVREAWLEKRTNLKSFIGLGLLWFLIALGPVIGLVQLGISKGADRFTYLPSIGISIILTALLLAGKDIVLRIGARIQFYVLLVAALISIYAVAGYKQISYWENTLTIFNQAIKVTKENDFAYGSAGLYYVRKLDPKAGFTLFFNSTKLWIIEKEEGNPLIRKPEEVMPNLIVSFAHRNGDSFEVEDGVSIIHNLDVFKYKFDLKDPYLETYLFVQGMYAFNNRSYVLAEEKLLDALYINPLNYYAWRILGYAREHEQRYNAALYAYKKSYALCADKRLERRIVRLEKLPREY